MIHVALALLILLGNASQSKDRQHPTPNTAKEQCDKSYSRLAFESLIESLKAAENHQAEQAHSKNDLDGWLYKAYLWVTIIGVVGGLGGIYLLYCQFTATKQTAEAASRNSQALINRDRAWIDAEVNPSIVAQMGTRMQYSYTLTVWNRGRTPAEVTGYRIYPETINSEHSPLSEQNRVRHSQKEDIRRLLPLGERYTFNPFDAMEAIEGAAPDAELKDIQAGRLRKIFVLVIFIHYYDILDRKSDRWTKIAYRFDQLRTPNLVLMPQHTDYK